MAVVHEWVTARAGSELCFERLAHLFPTADLVCLAADPSVPLHTADRPIRTTVLNNVCQSPRGRAAFLPAMPLAFGALRSNDYDIVISSSHAFSRAFAHPDALHLSYTYTPMRYAWYPETDARSRVNGALLGPARRVLRSVDRRLARRVDSFAGISTDVVDRIAECYDRSAELIFPPCDTDFFLPADAGSEPTREPYLLSVGRLIPYKRHDLVIELGQALGLPVVVAGSGPEAGRLAALAARTTTPVEFVQNADRAAIRDLYRGALATVFPPFEDFGIVPVESMACGTPVVALSRGGSLDTVSASTGALAVNQTVASFRQATLGLLADRPGPAACREQAERFSVEAFDRAITSWVDAVVRRGR